MVVDRSKWPPLVRIGLWGLPNKSIAWFFAIASLFLALVCLVLGLFYPAFFLGLPLVFAALWYYLAIRWVDQHSHWS